jgi:hypothetical protein
LEERDLLRKFLAGLGLIPVILVSVVYGADVTQKKDALNAAENWLAIIDKGEYAESWKEAAEYFKTAVSQNQWVNSLQAFRKPLGKLNSRTVKSKTYKTSLPGAPDGEYMVIQFTTSFENKKSAIETVTPMKDKDGKWRVSGYFIK